MKLSKSQRSNLIFFGIIAIIFFTPIRGYIQEFSAKILATSPATIDQENRVGVADFNWNLKGINTADYNFVNAKEKVVFINFWATWCPPCRAEMPAIQNLFDLYKDKVEFIFVTNEDHNIVNTFLNEKKYTLPSYNQYNNTPKEFSISSIPATYIINKKGEIVVHKVGPADWDSEKTKNLLDQLLLE